MGDEVLARNMATGKREYKKVIALTRPHQDHLLELKIEGERSAIEATPSHPFWVKRTGDAAAWITAGKMHAGDLVLTEKGKWEKVTEDISLNKLATVYNFEVQDDHDYFVGTSGVLVHNAGPCLPTLNNLNNQLASEEAASAFNANGGLSQEAIDNSQQIIDPSNIGNPDVPSGYGKYTTPTYQSPSGPFWGALLHESLNR